MSAFKEAWLKQYPKDVPQEIDALVYTSLVDMFETSCQRYTDAVAYISMDQTLTYQEIEEKSRIFAAFLQNRCGLQKGDRIALMMPNLLQYPIALFGALRAGLVVVNVNPLYTARELKHQLCDSGAQAIVVLSNFATTLAQIIEEVPVEHVVVTQLGDELSPLKRTLVNFVVKHVKKIVPDYHLPQAHNWITLMQDKALVYQKPDIQADDIAFLQYTGGTTGPAKGAILKHSNILTNIEQCQVFCPGKLREQEEFIVTALPLYHIFALTVNCLLFFSLGAQNLLITNPRDIPGFIKELKKYMFTWITGVNTLFNALVNHPRFAKVKFDHLRMTIGGGMAVQKRVAQEWQRMTGVPLLEGYGLTETSPLATACPYDTESYNGSIGVPVPSTEIKLVDEQGQEIVDCNTPGEIYIRGPQVMSGYWQRPEETAHVLQDNWFASGDIGIFREDGFFQIVDRKKDMILVSGFNVYPNEIEDVMMMHPDVLEAAAIGIPAQESGEKIKVFIVAKNSQVSCDDLIRHARDYLTPYKVPKEIEFRDELPKTNVGKILRRELREQELSK